MTNTARHNILTRIRNATHNTPDTPITRNYHQTHHHQNPTDLLTQNLTDYHAHVHHTTEHHLPTLITTLTRPRLLTPHGIPPTWIPPHLTPHTDTPPLTPTQLDTIDTVITTCTLAIAETGTIILTTGPGQGRRALTLIPDHHICIIHTHQIHPSLPTALPHLNPTHPHTWISGPSATSDIELQRIEGVHGPRRLDAIILHPEE